MFSAHDPLISVYDVPGPYRLYAFLWYLSGEVFMLFAHKGRNKSTHQFLTVLILQSLPDRLKIKIFHFKYISLWSSEWETRSNIICVSWKEVRNHVVQSLHSQVKTWRLRDLTCPDQDSHCSSMRGHRSHSGFSVAHCLNCPFFL